ncbi:S-layer homology domain-containing protein [Ruminococcaceae bacterium AM07-15]|nr:S-layer homology domain-containing protein [Ruminococcaceae bacterium AM07-15]
MYKVVAADANDSTTNPDKDTDITGKLTIDSTAQPVEITVGLPAGFVDSTSSTVYVYHKNHIYETTVQGNADDGFTATFTNPHGFSAFTLKTTAGASVTDLNGQKTVYATLQDAVNAVKDGETITLLANGQTATVAKTVTFTVAGGNTCTIKDGYGNLVKPDKNGVYTITFYGYPSDGGSTTTPTSYGITVSAAENGAVKSSNSSAAKDATVTITVTPGEGYVLDTLTVTDKNNNTVALTKVSDTQYTFKMPASAVTVKATFKKDEGTQPAALPFNDVSESEWFYEAVKYVYDKGMMNGVSDTSFAPYSNLTRGMIAQVLYNLEGKPAVSGSTYTDVAADQWYNDAVNWAAQKGIVTGYGDGTFGPMDNITREQMAAILYRYAQYKGYDVSAKGDLTAFTDGNTVSDWAKDAMSWAVGTALFNGKGDGILDPTTTATRAEVAKILMTYCENVAK